MSKSNQTLKDAIAEAKTLRETALANAKAALEEAFTPQLQSMLAAKLNELEEDTKEEDEALENIAEEGAMEETLDLEALLAEESEESVEETIEEAEKEEGEEEGEEEEAGEEEAGEEEGEEEGDEEKDITDMSHEEVEDYIRKIAAEEFEKLEAEQGEELPGEEEAGEEMADMEGEEEINLDEEISEEVVSEEEAIEENEDEINIDELLAEFGIEEEKEEEDEAMYETKEEDSDKMKKMEEELALALSTIDELRSSLQETNLLNAKLLYMNKVFKGHNLTESQKVQVVKTFDKAESAKEAKLVFESLSATLAKKEEKAPIKENLGFASKASGIVEGVKANKVIDADAQTSRWEKLAGLR